MRIRDSLFPIYEQKLMVAEQGRPIYIFKISLVTNILHFFMDIWQIQCSLWYCTEWRARSKSFIWDTPCSFCSHPSFPLSFLCFPWEVASSPSLKIFKIQLLWGLDNAISLWRKAHFERCLDKRLPEVSFKPEVFQVFNSIFRSTWCKHNALISKIQLAILLL